MDEPDTPSRHSSAPPPGSKIIVVLNRKLLAVNEGILGFVFFFFNVSQARGTITIDPAVHSFSRPLNHALARNCGCNR